MLKEHLTQNVPALGQFGMLTSPADEHRQIDPRVDVIGIERQHSPEQIGSRLQIVRDEEIEGRCVEDVRIRWVFLEEHFNEA